MFGKTRQWFLLALTLSSAGLSACTRISTPNTPAEHFRTTTARRGTFRRNLRLNGSVGAVESFAVLAPRLSGQMMGTGMMVITSIVRNGIRVRKGDILVEFDRQNQLKTILDRQAEYDGLVQQIRKKQADQTSTKISDETEITGAEVDVRTALVEMRKNDLIPRFQAEINKADLAEAEAQLKQLKETYKLKRQAETADLRILEIQRDRAQKALEWAKSNVEKMTVLSPIDGLAVLTPTYKGTRLVEPQEGDEVRSGAVLMMVVNPSAMKVSARINQVDVAEVHTGQSAEIRLDAYPDLVFPGRVEQISAMSTGSSSSKRIRYFSTVISILGKNPKLLPDLTAAVDVELQNLKNVLMLPREAIMVREGRQAVELLVNGKSQICSVKTGPMNDFLVVIESGLQEGAVVVLNP